MKNFKLFFLISFLSFLANESEGQTINWVNLKSEQKHIVSINTGWDYAFILGIAYGYKLNTKPPIILNVEYSMPTGKQLIDDFKSKFGCKIRIYHFNNFQVSANISGVFRRFENPLVRLVNFGSDATGLVGYYKPNWHIATEVGFDMAIATHFKHSEIFKNTIYTGVKDGWYDPTTGGNLYYGLQVGGSLKRIDLTFKIGKIITQDFKTTPLVPYYTQLALNYKI